MQGQAKSVIADLRSQGTQRGLASSAKVKLRTLTGFLESNLHHTQYDEYLAAGCPIATGVIEGACRHLVKDRMDITGARWGLTGAEAILRLRSLHVSGDLPAYWAFHRSEEFVRNHAASYADVEDEWLFREAA